LKLIIATAAAFALGIVVMLIPIMTFTAFTTVVTTKGASLSGGENDTSQPAEAQKQRYLQVTSFETLKEAAQTYGMVDATPAPSSATLLHAGLLIAGSLVAAVGVSLFTKRKMKLV